MKTFYTDFQTLCEYWPELSSSVPIKIPGPKKEVQQRESRIFFQDLRRVIIIERILVRHVSVFQETHY